MIRVFEVPGIKMDAVKALVKDDLFARNGYELRNEKGLGLDGEKFYLYVDGDDAFWTQVDEKIEALELVELKEKELERITVAFKEQLNGVGSAVGALFS